MSQIGFSSTIGGFLPKEIVSELEKMKTSTQATHEWLQGVGLRGEILIKEILSTYGDVHRLFEWLKKLLVQDKGDVDLLLQKIKKIMDYTKEILISNGIFPSSKVSEPWESYEALQIKQRVLKKIHKQGQHVGNTLNEIYNKCISFFEVMSRRNKFASKHLSLEQLRKWWHEVYAPSDDGPITAHHLDDVATYIAMMEKFLNLQVEWDKVIKESREEIKSIERRFKLLIIPSHANLEKIFIRVQDKLGQHKGKGLVNV